MTNTEEIIFNKHSINNGTLRVQTNLNLKK